MKDRITAFDRPHTKERLLLKQAATLLAADLSLGDLFDRLTRMLAEHIDSSVVFIALANASGNHAIEYFYDHGEIRRYPHIELSPKSRARAAIESGGIIWGNAPDEWAPGGSHAINQDRPWTNDSVSAIFVPMRAAGEVIGALSVQSPRANAYDTNDVDMIAAIGHYLAIAVQNQRMYQALQRTAEFDPLTTLANHSKLSRDLDRALAGSTSTRPCVAVMLNLVNFGMFNEIYGYAEGDEVLRRVARELREFEEAHDHLTVGRFGGDVFMALVSDASPDLIDHLVERLATRLAGLAYVSPDQTLPISVACGYVIAPLEAGTRGDVTALCVHRTRLSRKQGGVPVGPDDLDAYTTHGNFTGVETIVEGLLDRDPYTRVHLLQVNAMAKLWSEYNLELDGDMLAQLLQASLLHDVGKLLVSDRILIKPGRLTRDEYEAMQQHSAFGKHILEHQPGYQEVAEIVGQHHERWDGFGYPLGLKGDQIHPLARAVAILDAFSAMVSDRPYHRGISETAALAELLRNSGTQFDPDLVERFVLWREEGSPPPLA